MSLEDGADKEPPALKWEPALVLDRAGYKLVDEQGNMVGCVYQSLLVTGEWVFSHDASRKTERDFKSSEEAKKALMKLCVA